VSIARSAAHRSTRPTAAPSCVYARAHGAEVLVLAYHAVSEHWPADLSVTPERLASQLRLVLARGYQGATLQEAISDPPAKKTVVVTFDDGFRSVVTHALPILDHHNIPGTVFVPTDYIGTDEPMRWPGIDRWYGGRHEAELLPMGWPDLAMLADAGWEVGSHTRSHPRLTQLDDASLEAELYGSRVTCERELAQPCRTLAYPYGDHDARVVAVARAAGYEAACTLPEDFRTDSALRTPRVGVYNRDSVAMFRIKISPWTCRARRSRAWPRASRAVRRARGRLTSRSV
jgi:peptidoglycan/xylan/chitin deacetylase (PgdA/CDA1 family)